MKKLFLILFYLFFVNVVSAQSLSNIVEKKFLLISDTIVIDSLSIIPGSLVVFCNNELLPHKFYSVNYEKAVIYFKNVASLKHNANCKIKYRVFPVNFSSSYYHKGSNLLGDSLNRQSQKRYNPVDEPLTFFSSSKLTKTGSISRGINFGNNQDASVNSDFNLQLSGKISSDVTISANISDSNIPVQADGTSQHLREFDNVFIELSSRKSKLTVGDFEMLKPKGYFMNFHKKVQGIGFKTKVNGKKNSVIEISANTSISKGKYNRQNILALEGNQGPYKLEGVNNELYVIVLSGSEKIYIDGELMIRGNENDYVMNYNTAELTFTANRLITKNTRIIAEFEYSELSYAEFVLSSETTITNKNSQFYINIFADQDAENQNVRQDLTDSQKLMFYDIGDNLNEAVTYNIQKIDTFNRNEVLYRKTDTIVAGFSYNDVFVYSTDSLNANYRLGFSSVGENKGNYIRIQSATNGRVYKWLTPEKGIPQGNYEPIKLLISPKKKQMISVGGNFSLKKTNVNFEAAISNNDLNTFSNIDNDDNSGYAFKFGINKNLLKKDTNNVQLNIGTDYYFTHKYFTAIETYRRPEYNRDWNLTDFLNNKNEHNLNLSLEYKKRDFGKIAIISNLLDRQESYSGNKNSIIADIQKKRISFFSDINRLTSKDTINKTEFLRYDFKLERKGKFLTAGVRNFGEKNIFKNLTNDSLSLMSYRFNQPEIYVRTSKKNTMPILLSYANREDFLPTDNVLQFVSNSHDYKFSGTVLKTKTQKLKTSVIYRTLHYKNDSIDKDQSEKTLTGRLEHNLKIFKNAVSNRIFVEHISGNEPFKEFTYIQVQNGQGLFTWEDFNNNNIKELNEFVKANFQDEANYIRVSLPTNEYRRVYNQSFNYVLSLNPRRIWFNEKGIKKLLSNLSNKFSYKLNRKIDNNSDYFQIQTADSSLLSQNSMLNNNLRLNIKPTKTIFNLVYISNESKLLLVNGIETRKNDFYNLTLNQRFKSFVFVNTFKKGSKIYDSEFFEKSDYNIDYFQNETSFTYKIDNKTDLVANFILKEKYNFSGEEIMNSYNLGAEYKFTSLNRGTIMLKFDYIDIDFTGSSNTSISYEMLEGLKIGKNYVWSVLWHKKITKYLQLELNYFGRKSEDNKIIHSGGISVRAIF